MTPGLLALYLLIAYGIGWWAGRRAPDGVEYVLWIRMLRKLRKRRIRDAHPA